MKGKSSLKCRDCSIFGSLLAAAADWHDKFPLKPINQKKICLCVQNSNCKELSRLTESLSKEFAFGLEDEHETKKQCDWLTENCSRQHL